MTVINPATGKEFRWNSHRPAPNAMAHWSRKSMYGQTVKGSVRHIAHIDRLDRLSMAHFHQHFEIIQPAYNSTVSKSAGTHDLDATIDFHIPGVGWWTQQMFGRKYGLGCWYRPTSSVYGWSNHVHGFTLPPHIGGKFTDDFAQGHFKVGIYIDGGISTKGYKSTSAQIDDYYAEAFGLSGRHTPGSDKSWFPDNKQATIFNLNAYIERRARIQAAA